MNPAAGVDVDGYTAIWVRTDVFEQIESVRKLMRPRISVRKLSTALLVTLLANTALTAVAVKTARRGKAAELRRQAEQLTNYASKLDLANQHENGGSNRQFAGRPVARSQSTQGEVTDVRLGVAHATLPTRQKELLAALCVRIPRKGKPSALAQVAFTAPSGVTQCAEPDGIVQAAAELTASVPMPAHAGTGNATQSRSPVLSVANASPANASEEHPG